ncbi:hypothetical protein WJX81_003113 [Elliptochloris bilobata]|uniref:Nuclear control of ATPase protein 2 n=1 Tax=Elliptochloris bilobata TaxID=381761 RepID=A0AAW1S6T6_9CHLO
MLGGIVWLPFAAAKHLLLALAPSQVGAPADVWPVAGLDAERASCILYALRQAAATEEEVTVVEEWLSALQMAQVTSDRLMHDLNKLEASRRFWAERLAAGQHRAFLLLARGPTSFVREILALLRGPRHARDRRIRQQHADDEDALTASDQIERRVFVLGMLRERLGEVGDGAAGGGGNGAPPQHAQDDRAPAAAAPDVRVRCALLAAAKGAAGECASSIVEAVEAVEAAVHELAGTAPAPPEPEGSRLLRMAGGALRRASGSIARQVARAAGALRRVVLRGQAADDAHGNGDGGDGSVAAASERQGAPGSGPVPDSAAERATMRTLWRAAELLRVEPVLARGGVGGGGGVSAQAALAAAAAEAARRRGLVAIPRWLLAPSRYQRHWVRYGAASAAGAFAVHFLYRHSRLAGSSDLEDWAARAYASLAGALVEHVLEPLAALRDHLFNTFRQRPSMATPEEFETERKSLARMLAAYESDYLRSHGGRLPDDLAPAATAPNHTDAPARDTAKSAPGSPTMPAAKGSSPTQDEGGDQEDALAPGMALLMRSYEDELKRPIRSALGGQLARSLLIQLQKLKVDTEAAMLELDQIMRQNELTIAVVAALPALAIASFALAALRAWLTPSPPDPRWEALPARMAMVEVERAVAALAAAHDPAAKEAARGALIWRAHRVFKTAAALFRRHAGLGFVLARAAASEWPSLRRDLIELAAPGGDPTLKAAVCARIMRAYSLFQPA